MTRLIRVAALVLVCGWPTALPAVEADAVRQATGIDRGLAVVIDSRSDLASDLADEGRLLVHLLAPDAGAVTALRAKVQERRLGGRVVVHPLPADGHLPHPDRFVNLLVADLDALKSRAPKPGEIDRVLAVRGAGYLKRGDRWQARPTPPDDRLDGWSHRFYDATGNCVGRDGIAAFPRAVQWQHGPAMEDGCADGKTPRIAQGRAVALDASSGDLLCRDAGNGILLWRRFIGSRQNADLAVSGGRIYLWHDTKASPGGDPKKAAERGPMVALDLATGNVVQVYDEGLRAATAKPVEWEEGGRQRKQEPVPWFVVSDRLVVQAYGPDLVVLDRDSGKRRWSRTLDGATWFSPVVIGDLVLAAEAVRPARRGRHDGTTWVRAVTAYAMADGAPRWRNQSVHPERNVADEEKVYLSRAEFKPISAAGDRVLLHVSSYQYRQGGSIALLDARDGRERWRHEFNPKALYTQGSQRAVLRGDEVIVLDGTGAFRFDARTGDPAGEVSGRPKIRRQARANGACTASRATVNWLICNAYLYVGPDGQAHTCFGARGACGQGVVPANGLVFVPPTPCDCGDYTRGYQALAPRVPGRGIPDKERLARGVPAPAAGDLGDAWPVFLADAQRSSRAQGGLPEKLRERWRVQAANVRADDLDSDRRWSERHLGALSAPVIGAGLVLVAAPETHEVLAFGADTGDRRWAFSAGGKVDSPPTLACGLAVFGCDDGAVYALRASDGQLVWRFCAAPTDGVAMHHGHLASAFPVPGSVLVLGDAVVAVAGHHTDLGGLHVWVLDLATGTPRAGRAVRDDQPAVVANGVAVADSGGAGFWIGQQLHLGLDLKDLPAGREAPGPPVWFDRSGTRLRFRTNDARGGSTHEWKGAARLGRHAGHRLARDGRVAFVMRDPTDRDRHPVRADQIALVAAVTGTEPKAKELWSASVKSLGSRESYGALIKAGDHLVLGGGARDGSTGFVQVLDAKSGTLLATLDLRSRVTECGLATAEGRLYVCCEDGTLVCLE